MPHWQERTNNSRRCEWCKTHRNGEKTTVKVTPSGEGFEAFVEDNGRSERIGRFTEKAEAETAAKNWMRRNPKGLESQPMNGGTIPGMNGAKQSNDFFSF